MTQSSHEIQIARRIKSRAQIAQLVEQRTENPRVTGSIPVLGTFLLENCSDAVFLHYTKMRVMIKKN